MGFGGVDVEVVGRQCGGGHDWQPPTTCEVRAVGHGLN